jgi:hypothetical protein
MKYIVWDLISDYDGFWQTECATWEEAVACVRAACKENKKALAQFKKWQEGKIAEIRVMGKGFGKSEATEVNVFVTSKKLTEPQE